MQLKVSIPFDPSSEASLAFDSLPAQPAVFALFLENTGGEAPPPYLARTADLRRRLRRLLSPRHPGSRMLNLRDVARRIDYQCVGSGFEAHWLLYQINKFHYPKHYRRRLRLKPFTFLKLNLANRYPRCYPTRRLSPDGSLYYGPFPSRTLAERFSSEFLDFFKIRRCVEELQPDPAHPGCIYSQMQMCMAPCFAGCTDQEYHEEVNKVVKFLDTQGDATLRGLQSERAGASETLEFEQAARAHRKIEKVQEVLRQRPELARNIRDLNGVIVQRAADPKSVVFFRLRAGEILPPVALSLDENVPSPVPLDEQLHALLDMPGADAVPGGAVFPAREAGGEDPSSHATAPRRARLPSWEHLSLLARWYYSSFRQGELALLDARQTIPHARLIRLCRKVLTAES